ncbi:hypothetical protein [Azospirillum griseum]|nr:hypothetical protein [Azospirillum griseum]
MNDDPQSGKAGGLDGIAARQQAATGGVPTDRPVATAPLAA